MERCSECGFEYDLTVAADAGTSIVQGSTAFAELLLRGSSDLRARPSPQVWSPLEYGCHLRDVLLVQRERILLARREDAPTIEPMGRDERAEHDGYAVQDPRDVARQLHESALMMSNVLSRLSDDDWERMVMFRHRTPPERSIRWLAVHTLHEVRHHLLDARP